MDSDVFDINTLFALKVVTVHILSTSVFYFEVRISWQTKLWPVCSLQPKLESLCYHHVLKSGSEFLRLCSEILRKAFTEE